MKVDYLYKHGGKDAAADTLNRSPKRSVLKLTIDKFDTTIDIDLTISEAKDLAAELMEFAKDVEEHADLLRRMQSNVR